MECCGVKLDVPVFNVLISGLCANGDVVVAFELYEEMKQRGLMPNTTTYTLLIGAVSSHNNLIKAEQLLGDLSERGLISGNLDGSAQTLHERLMNAMGRLNSLRRIKGTNTKERL